MRPHLPSPCRPSRAAASLALSAAVLALAGADPSPSPGRDTLPAPVPAPIPSESPGNSARPLSLVKRTVIQDRGDWRVEYRLRHEGATGLVVTPGEVVAKVEGWVSNSRAPGHSAPRWSSMTVSGPTWPSAASEVIATPNEERRCLERVVVQAWADDLPAPPVDPKGAAAAGAESGPVLSLVPGGVVCVRLLLEHQHALYGDYNPLLGRRTVELRLGPATFRDVAPLDVEHHRALPEETLASPPAERLDTTHYVSGPDSLLLFSHPLGGNPAYRFPELPVRYSTPMRLRFWYLIAPGTEGTCRVRVQQYKDIPGTWRVLMDAEVDQCLPVIGGWTFVERVIATEREATRLSLDFRIAGDSDAGAVWIDDVSLEPLAAAPKGP